MKDETIEKVYVLSTSHMPSNMPNFGGRRAVEHEYGYMVFGSHCVGPTKLDSRGQFKRRPLVTPEWLQPVLDAATKAGCKYVNFDQDADTIDGLQTWNWG